MQFTALAQDTIDYNFDVKPILSDRCFLCHGFDEAHRAAKLRLDTPEGAFTPLDGKAPIVPGDAEASEVWKRIISDDPNTVMPTPESHLSLNSKEKEIIKRWINEGAKYKKHWAFLPPTRPTIPEVSDPSWVNNPIDAFIMAKLDKHDLKPSKKADKKTLSRRFSLDLTGLHPQGQTTISALIDSKHFGERWALPWLDAARYADSNGFQGDPNNFAYPWRDYMIKSLNENKPYDQLIKELIAGDLLKNPTQDQLVATSFNRLHPISNEGGAIKKELLFNYYVDRVDATATTFLGLTFACAQCHDHKYDPVSHKEYFSFMAFFSNIKEQAQPRQKFFHPDNTYLVSKPTLTLKDPDIEAQIAQAKADYDLYKNTPENKNILDKIAAAEIAWCQEMSDEKKRKKLNLSASLIEITSIIRAKKGLNTAQVKELRDYFLISVAQMPEWSAIQANYEKKRNLYRRLNVQLPRVMVMKERKQPAEHRLHERGIYDAPTGKPIPAGIPTALGSLPEGPANRLTLAQWLISEKNPLTARVLVNRIWQEIFGTGIVKTPEDFGFQGALPTHPDLLDWLAVEFRESGWDHKALITLILESNTYQQSSETNSMLLKKDPKNELLARGPRFRLASSLIRDNALAVSGLLDDTQFGPPTYPNQPNDLWKEVSFNQFFYPNKIGPKQQYRRSLYTFWRRTMGPPNMFDAANRQMCVVKPSRTNTPLQALTLFNDPIFVKSALALAHLVKNSEDPLSDIFYKVTHRQPSEREKSVLKRAYDREHDHFKKSPDTARTLTNSVGEGSPKLAALTLISQMVLNLDESITKQ